MQTNNKQEKTKQMRNVNNILYHGNCMGKAAKKAESKCLQGKATRGKPIYTPGPGKAQEFIILGSLLKAERHKAGPHEEVCVPGACPTLVARQEPLLCQEEDEVHSERIKEPGAGVWALGTLEGKKSFIQEKKNERKHRTDS